MDAQEQRRLLELAAKAVGFIDDATDESEANGLHRGSDDVFYITSSDGWREWNPLVDDGDALRLAVELLFEIDMDHRGIAIRHAIGIKVLEVFNHDPYAATRLAIVRAAAEIGKSMEK